MTVYTLEAGAPGITLPGGTVLALEAISPTTGNHVGGVTVAEIVVYGYDRSEATGALEPQGPFMFVPGSDAVPV